MPVETPVATAAARPAATGRRAGRGPDPFEWGVLGLFCVLSLFVIVSNVVEAHHTSLIWTRTDGFFSGDQLQYLAWIRSSAKHVLVSDMYVLRPTAADYFQPAIVLSGLLVRAGVASWLALLLWKPVAVVGLFAAVRALVHHCFERRFDRRVALVLVLLYASLTPLYGSLNVVGDMMPMWLSWGYVFGLMAIALMVFAMLRYVRARERGQIAWAPGLLAALAASLHPWQGELMILIIVGSELLGLRNAARSSRAGGPRAVWRALREPRCALALLTLTLVALPLLYYFALGHLDPVWTAGQAHSKHAFSWTAPLIAGAPLALFALLGYRGAPDDFLELMLRVWPVAAAVMWIFAMTALGASPQHSLGGITVPLTVLAVRGVRRSSLPSLPHARALACVLVVIGTLPADLFSLLDAHVYTNPTPGNANWITQGESEALAYLAHSPAAGGVLTTYYLGAAVPGITGRQAFVGNCLWSEPLCPQRDSTVGRLFTPGEMSAPVARRFVRRSGARFILEGCDAGADLRPHLAGMLASVHRFGCARVYELQRVGPARGPFAAVATTALG